jgi:hypothetical protein
LAVLFIVLDTCPHSIQNRTVSVITYEDSDADGEWDRDESPIENTLVVGVYNVHGSFTHLGRTTDAAGEVTVSAEYTHFFNLTIVPPCGYRATTETVFTPENNRDIEVGFAPEDPREGVATVEIVFWEEKDEDGVMNPGEELSNNYVFYVDVIDEEYRDVAQSNLMARTDEEGRVTLDMGNSCGTLWVRAPMGRLFLDGSNWTPVSYDLGVTDISIGLEGPPPSPATTATPAP